MDNEGRIGILTYLSKTKGIGGTIKGEPEDFRVEETIPSGTVLEIGKHQAFPTSDGEYTHFTLEKRNWDTIRAIKEISKRVRVSHTRFKYAGTKDRRSISTQRVSAWRVPKESLERVKIKDISLRDYSFSDEPVNLGCLDGNRFTVTIKGVCKGSNKVAERIADELGGKTPNFFGTQRFGLRLNNHVIGKHILKSEFKEAVMSYLCDTGNEPREATEARERLGKTGDFKVALKEFPAYLGYEKSVLNRLAVEPTDYIGALRVLPKKLRLMFGHAYQGYVFNRALSEYILSGEIPPELPLVGYSTKPDSVTGKLLKKDCMKTSDFEVASMPEMSLEGEMRNTLVAFKDFEVVEYNEAGSEITLRFKLPPGSYATVLLREIMKT